MKYGKLTFGQIEAVLNRIGGEEGVQALLSGKSEVVVRKHIIDCMALPSIPEGFAIAKHTQAAPFEWDVESIQHRMYNSHQTIRRVSEIDSSTVLNATVADYLYAHPHLIPDSWVGRHLYFFGTLYQYKSPEDLFVQTLHFSGDGKWVKYLDRIDERQWSSPVCVALGSFNLEPV